MTRSARSLSPSFDNQSERDRDASSSDALGRVRDSLRDLKYGAVTLIVQDGVLVQIERTEKVRFRRLGTGS
jgi:hypothetical protein